MEKDCPSNNTRSKKEQERERKSDGKSKQTQTLKKKSRREKPDELDQHGNLRDFVVPDNFIEYQDGRVVKTDQKREKEENHLDSECLYLEKLLTLKHKMRNPTPKTDTETKPKNHKNPKNLRKGKDVSVQPKKQDESGKETSKSKNNKSVKIKLDEKKLEKLAGDILLSALLGGSLGKKKKSKRQDSDTESHSEQDSDSNYNTGDEDDEDDEELEYTLEEERYLKGLSKEDKTKIDELETQLQNFRKNDVPYRFKILNSSLDLNVKSLIIERLDQFYMMDSGDPEYHKLNRWLEGIMKIPFGEYSPPMISLESSPEKLCEFLSNTKQCLNQAVFGHEIVKASILQSVAMMISNPDSQGKILALQGPPGNGKTTLIREGVAKAMGRPFAFIALGGATDSCILEGHDFTYEGSQCGRIINILKKCGTMDPVICFDELDKLSETPKGEEIANLLCHLTDHSQNSQFHDKYYSGIDFDLSKATFIFSFNDITKVNPILLDRIKIIPTKGFKKEDKLKIAQDYLLPKICQNIGFSLSDLTMKDEQVKYIITNYTEEEGVRNLKRALETIVEKINLLKITQESGETPPTTVVGGGVTLKPDHNEAVETGEIETKPKKTETNKFELVSYQIKNLSFPFTLTNKVIDLLLKEDKKESNTSLDMLYL